MNPLHLVKLVKPTFISLIHSIDIPWTESPLAQTHHHAPVCYHSLAQAHHHACNSVSYHSATITNYQPLSASPAFPLYLILLVCLCVSVSISSG